MLSSLWAFGIGLGLGILVGRFGPKKPTAGRFPSLSSPVPLIDPEGVPGAPEPVFVEKDLRDRLQHLQLAYQQATEMSQFKAGFLARTSHELRSPLNGMIGMHQLILSDLCDDPAEERDFISQANAAALRMVDVLDNLLAVAKTEYGSQPFEPQPVQLAHLFQEVHLLTHLQAQNRNLRLEIPQPDLDLYALADPRSLRQVLVKLIDGAIAQMDSGHIRLTVQPAPDAQNLLILLEDQRSAAAWHEAIDLLKSDLPPETEIPTPGLNFLAIQTLLELMHGRLDVLETASEPDACNRIQCTIPKIQED